VDTASIDQRWHRDGDCPLIQCVVGEREKYRMYTEERTEDLPTIMFQKSMRATQNDERGEKEE